MIRAAIAQAAPVYLNRDATLALTESWIKRAAQDGAQMLVFPETWLPGYPAWLDVCRDIAIWDHPSARALHAKLRKNSITVPGPEVAAICGWAKEHQLVINLSCHERVDHGPANGTLFNTMLTIDADGSLLLAHRKLMPTFSERLIWGQGDGASLMAVDSNVGRVGGLICWEHWMPIPRQILHESGERIHVAAWPMVKEMNLVASRHYAFEGRCFVLAAGGLMHGRDLPSDLEAIEPFKSDPQAWVLRGGSAIIGPDGEILAGPVHEQETLLVADLDLGKIEEGFLTLDTTGHYARPDLFEIRRKGS